MFQSHLGSIQTKPEIRNCRIKEAVSIPPWFDSNFFALIVMHIGKHSFNPTLVRFKQRLVHGCTPQWGSFNPTLVRFKPNVIIEFAKALQSFNPTLVRFKRILRSAYMAGRSTFQSHLGSIQTGVVPVLVLYRRVVSIPPWFDSNTTFFTCDFVSGTSFNPTLVRFKLILWK